MEIIRAKHMGFCFGVLEAINVCNSLVEEKGRKYILGMLVHNKQVVEDMERKGFKLVKEEELLEDIDANAVLEKHISSKGDIFFMFNKTNVARCMTRKMKNFKGKCTNLNFFTFLIKPAIRRKCGNIR